MRRSVWGRAQALGPLELGKPVITTEFAKQTPNIRFNRWISGFQDRALAAGLSQSTIDTAFAGITYNTTVIDRDRNQSEFSKALWDYLDTAVSDARIRNGRAALDRNDALLSRIEAQYGVDKEIIVAIWGLESAYGAVRGSTNVIEAMATLAYDGRRTEFFEEQLIAALKILESGDTVQRNMGGRDGTHAVHPDKFHGLCCGWKRRRTARYLGR